MGCHCSDQRGSEIKENVKNPFAKVLDDQIKEYDLVMYSQSKDESSLETKNLLRKSSIAFEYFELDKLNDDKQVHLALVELTGRKLPPYIFIKGSFFGGLDELQKAIESGKFGSK